MPETRFDLRFEGGTLSASVEVPGESIRPVDLLPVLHNFTDAVVAVGIERATSRGAHISCHAGCGACCRQLVPISEIEARYLAHLIAAMPADQQRRVTARFAEVIGALAKTGLLRQLSSDAPSSPVERNRLGLDYFHLGLACPFLEQESCSIHPYRPASCREYLVSSPASNCASPGPDNIEGVELPVKLSQSLYRFSNGRSEEPARWIALPLLLEWFAAHRDDAQPSIPGVEMFTKFVNSLVKNPTEEGECIG